MAVARAVSRARRERLHRPAHGTRTLDVLPLASGSPPLDRAHASPVPSQNWCSSCERDVCESGPGSGETIPSRQLTESFYNIGSALQVWRFDSSFPRSCGPTLPNAEWILVELDEQVLKDRILPDLAHRYFQGTDGLDYEVAVVAGGAHRRVIYSSDPGFGDEDVVDADGRMDVFGRASATSGRTVRVFHRTSANTGPTAAVGVSWFPLLRQIPVDEDWQLVVRHRRGGPLGAFVSQMRQRGLAVSFIALLAARAERVDAARDDHPRPAPRPAADGLRHGGLPRAADAADHHRIGGRQHRERRGRYARTAARSTEPSSAMKSGSCPGWSSASCCSPPRATAGRSTCWSRSAPPTSSMACSPAPED